jgi:hypothetical protein
MRGKTCWGAWLLLLVACLTVAPLSAMAQEGGYAPADQKEGCYNGQLPVPLGSTRPEDGGVYTFGRFAYYKTNSPLREQAVAVRGFVASDNTIPTDITRGTVATIQVFPVNQTILGPSLGIPPGTTFPAGTTTTGIVGNSTTTVTTANGTTTTVTTVTNAAIAFNIPATAGIALTTLAAGTFVGSGTEALDVNQLNGKGSYQPGFEFGLGYKFRDGSSLSLSWLFLYEAQYRAGATLAPRFQQNGPQLAESFLFAPVFNFPPEYSGANFKVTIPPIPTGVQTGVQPPQPSPQAVFGIWNGASIMTLAFRQRFQQWDVTYREPVLETDDYRLSALVGPRFSWFWDGFQWRTTSIGLHLDNGGNQIIDNGPDRVADYSAITSNRMYGVFCGCEQECYLGHGFALHLTTSAAMLASITREKAEYSTEAKFLGLPENKIAKSEWDPVPELNAMLGLMWYPTEFVQAFVGYEGMVFFNTRVLRRPIDFDYSNINPKWTHGTRYLEGFRAGFGITF